MNLDPMTHDYRIYIRFIRNNTSVKVTPLEVPAGHGDITMGRGTSTIRRTFKIPGAVLVALLIILPLVVVVAGLYLHVPRNAAGGVAKAVCSATFLAGRPWQNLMADDMLPASPVMRAVTFSVNESEHSVTARFAGLFPRRAVLVRDRGCVLDLEPDPKATPFKRLETTNQPWPAGDAPLPPDQWDAGIDTAKLQKIADGVFIGAGDVTAANARGLAIVYKGRLLLLHEAPGFTNGTPLHGWSMTKTISGMLMHSLAENTDLPIDTPVVKAFAKGREPAWVGDWRQDDRRNIKVSDLLYMRDGLASTEDYTPWASVPEMLWGSPDMAAYGADYPPEAPPGTRWRYLSSTANLLAAVARGRFATDEQYWAYPARALFGPIGARTAVIETDTSGNWVASSYMWASTGDWARLGLLMLQDGKWGDRQVLPAGWLKRATTPSTAKGEGYGYGAHTWLFGHRQSGQDCKNTPGIPEDAIAMGGHWGQIVAMVPSRDLVVVRLGWTFNGDTFDDCKLIDDILSALPK
jgi:CubicO group peptidase (beta-lactamase class C family)